MKVKALDKRFRLCKEGKAAFYVDVEIQDFHKVNTILGEAYGMSGVFHAGNPRLQLGTMNRDWFYQYKHKIVVRKGVEPGGGNSSLVYLDQQMAVSKYRIFFRREEQAMFLILSMGKSNET